MLERSPDDRVRMAMKRHLEPVAVSSGGQRAGQHTPPTTLTPAQVQQCDSWALSRCPTQSTAARWTRCAVWNAVPSMTGKRRRRHFPVPGRTVRCSSQPHPGQLLCAPGNAPHSGLRLRRSSHSYRIRPRSHRTRRVAVPRPGGLREAGVMSRHGGLRGQWPVDSLRRPPQQVRAWSCDSYR